MCVKSVSECIYGIVPAVVCLRKSDYLTSIQSSKGKNLNGWDAKGADHYGQRIEGDNVLGSVRPSVRLSVCMSARLYVRPLTAEPSRVKIKGQG